MTPVAFQIRVLTACSRSRRGVEPPLLGYGRLHNLEPTCPTFGVRISRRIWLLLPF
ncbi:hypothetical protein BD414DRAFT_497360 [Trametes punicea]|nr:hypothetical protein BD414DRAFT_497360 [Trametes punicea]